MLEGIGVLTSDASNASWGIVGSLVVALNSSVGPPGTTEATMLPTKMSASTPPESQSLARPRP